jgi:hypothetical protein
LHYKGKGSDPYCADNYRGLGIGAALEKILSLIMMKRLEVFLQSTRSLHLSQGGFLPLRGPPEQVFTLSEAVRAELKRGGASAVPVHLCFIDIERAYDSVQHVKLWASCAKLGIGGRFLSTLQAMYAGKRAILDVDGELLDPQDIQCGVLQGNPLSPLLFNIYINDVLRDLDVFASALGSAPNELRPDLPHVDVGGIPLPFFDADGKLIPPPPGMVDRLLSLFFADDGVLIARSRLAMQSMLDHLAQLLEKVGLSLNAKKTKVMVVPPLSLRDKPYQSLKDQLIAAGGYQACGVAQLNWWMSSCTLVSVFGIIGIGHGRGTLLGSELVACCTACVRRACKTEVLHWCISCGLQPAKFYPISTTSQPSPVLKEVATERF